MVGTMRCDSEKDGQLGLIDISCLLQKEKPISKPNLSPDRGLQLILVKPKSLVVAGHQRRITYIIVDSDLSVKSSGEYVPAPCTHCPSMGLGYTSEIPKRKF